MTHPVRQFERDMAELEAQKSPARLFALFGLGGAILGAGICLGIINAYDDDDQDEIETAKECTTPRLKRKA